MNTNEELEMHLQRVRLPYRELWLGSECALAEIEIVLGDALGVEAASTQLDALALAEAAAYRLRELERLRAVVDHQPRLRGRRERVPEFA
jgi:hypothetical protein